MKFGSWTYDGLMVDLRDDIIKKSIYLFVSLDFEVERLREDTHKKVFFLMVGPLRI